MPQGERRQDRYAKKHQAYTHREQSPGRADMLLHERTPLFLYMREDYIELKRTLCIRQAYALARIYHPLHKG
jgi:hypothetical protein